MPSRFRSNGNTSHSLSSFYFLIAPQFPDSAFDPYPPLSLPLGAAAVIAAAVSHSQSDESRDHPEAAGTQLRSN